MQLNTIFNIPNKNWQKQDQTIIKNSIKTIFETITLKTIQNCQVEISIVLGNNDFLQSLNEQYRNINKPTNTLSFPLNEINLQQQYNQELLPLGDVILAKEYIQDQAKEQNKTFKNHLTHLTIHSVLHLLGFDHQNDTQAQEMESLEIKILKKLDIDNPYMLR